MQLSSMKEWKRGTGTSEAAQKMNEGVNGGKMSRCGATDCSSRRRPEPISSHESSAGSFHGSMWARLTSRLTEDKLAPSRRLLTVSGVGASPGVAAPEIDGGVAVGGV